MDYIWFWISKSLADLLYTLGVITFILLLLILYGLYQVLKAFVIHKMKKHSSDKGAG